MKRLITAANRAGWSSLEEVAGVGMTVWGWPLAPGIRVINPGAAVGLGGGILRGDRDQPESAAGALGAGRHARVTTQPMIV
jgi:hypothetical protein